MMLNDLLLTFSLILTFAFSDSINLKCFVDDGFFWKFSLLSGINVYSIYEDNVENYDCNVTNTSIRSNCDIEDHKGIVSCKTMQFLEVHEIKIGKKSYQRRFCIFGGENKTVSTMKYIANTIFTFDSCHLANCEGAVPLAMLIRTETKAEADGKFSLQYKINLNSIYSVVPFVSIHQLGSNNTREITPFLNASYGVDDVCGYYNVCIVSKWTACFENKKIQQSARDCQNISFYQMINLSGLKFHCHLHRQTKKLSLDTDTVSSLVYKFIYDIYQNGKLIQSYDTRSNLASIFLPQVTDPVKLRSNLTICDKCNCFQDVAVQSCSVSPSSTNDKIFPIVSIIVGLILLLAILCGLIIFYKRKVKTNADHEEDSDVEITNPRNFHLYHNVDEPPAPYDKLCIIDPSLTASCI